MGWETRLQKDHDKLERRLGELRRFLSSSRADTLEFDDIGLLSQQEMHMAYYLQVLKERIDRLEA